MIFADKGVRALETARECALLGARTRTIVWITGLPPTFIRHNVFDHEHPAPCGRPPYHDEFLFRSPLRVQAEASAFANTYQALRSQSFPPAQSLIAAFRHYVSLAAPPSLCFDSAFYVVCSIDGIWACGTRTLQIATCTRCGSHHIASKSSVQVHGCPFCKKHCDHSTQNANGCRSTRAQVEHSIDGNIARTFSPQLRALKFQRGVQDLGAHSRVVNALMSTIEGLPPSHRPPHPSRLVRVRTPLPLHNWGAAVRTVMRVQYSLAASAYRRLSASGFTPEEAVVGAYRHVHAMFHDETPLTFDRCFEVLSLLDARWGVRVPEFDIVHCERCGAHQLASRRDRTRPLCPFCLLIRRPNTYFPHALPSPPPASRANLERL